MYHKQNYQGIFLLLLILSCFLCIYYDFYRIFAVMILINVCLIKAIITIKNHLNKFKDRTIMPITINGTLQEYHEEIKIKYTDIVKGASYDFYHKDGLTFVLSSTNGKNYVRLDDYAIDGVKLSPIYDYGIIFMQKLMDNNQDTFCIQVKFQGFFIPSLTLKIQRC